MKINTPLFGSKFLGSFVQTPQQRPANLSTAPTGDTVHFSGRRSSQASQDGSAGGVKKGNGLFRTLAITGALLATGPAAALAAPGQPGDPDQQQTTEQPSIPDTRSTDAASGGAATTAPEDVAAPPPAAEAPAPVEEEAEPAPVEDEPEPAPVEDEPEPAPVEEEAEPAPVEDEPEPAPVEDEPEPAPADDAIPEYEMDPETGEPVQTTPEDVTAPPTEPEATEPAPVEDEPEPAPVEEEAEPAPVEDEPEPAPVEDEPEPAPVEDEPEPAPVEDEPEPAPVEDEPEPAPADDAIPEYEMDPETGEPVQTTPEDVTAPPTEPEATEPAPVEEEAPEAPADAIPEYEMDPETGEPVPTTPEDVTAPPAEPEAATPPAETTSLPNPDLKKVFDIQEEDYLIKAVSAAQENAPLQYAGLTEQQVLERLITLNETRIDAGRSADAPRLAEDPNLVYPGEKILFEQPLNERVVFPEDTPQRFAEELQAAYPDTLGKLAPEQLLPLIEKRISEAKTVNGLPVINLDFTEEATIISEAAVPDNSDGEPEPAPADEAEAEAPAAPPAEAPPAETPEAAAPAAPPAEPPPAAPAAPPAPSAEEQERARVHNPKGSVQGPTLVKAVQEAKASEADVKARQTAELATKKPTPQNLENARTWNGRAHDYLRQLVTFTDELHSGVTAAEKAEAEAVEQAYREAYDATSKRLAKVEAEVNASQLLNTYTPEKVAVLFPKSAAPNIRTHLPNILDALKEVGLDDKQMVLYALATIRPESSGFIPRDEIGGTAYFTRNYEGRSDLGNTQAGDGARYHGRGFIQITGRHNYTKYSKALGVDLVGNPDLANDSKVASRILAQYIKDREGSIRAALNQGDLQTAREKVNGGLNGFSEFSAAYTQAQQIF